jgi:exodeoxyribonuclease III
MKFMTWNIKTGGGTRLSAIVTVIKREQPDLLALQELRDFQRDDGRRMQDVADALGMTAHLAPSAFGQPVAILARPPFSLSRTKAIRWQLHHAAAVATVGTGRGPLTVVSTHLNPFSPYRRLREARWLSARYASRKKLVVLAGDLNSLAPDMDHTSSLAALPRLYRRRHEAPDGTADTRAMAAFGEAGFIDLWPAAGSGDGRTAPTTQGGGAEFSGMRLDYLLGSGPVAARAREMRVIRGGETEFASDHYPVTATLDL